MNKQYFTSFEWFYKDKKGCTSLVLWLDLNDQNIESQLIENLLLINPDFERDVIKINTIYAFNNID